MTNPYHGTQPYESAWQHGHEYGIEHPGSEQPETPDFAGWGFDATTTGYIGQVWQEGALAGRTVTATARPATTGTSGIHTGMDGGVESADGGVAHIARAENDVSAATHAGATMDGGVASAGSDAGIDGGALRAGPVVAVNASGEVVAHGHATAVSRAGTTRPPTSPEAMAFEALSDVVGELREMHNLCHAINCTVAAGISATAGGGLGVSIGEGVYVTPSGVWGYYDSLAADLGLIIGGDISLAVTVVEGGAEALSGSCYAVVFGGGEGVVGSISFLFSESAGGFLGMAASIGVGLWGTFIAAYAQYGYTWIEPRGQVH